MSTIQEADAGYLARIALRDANPAPIAVVAYEFQPDETEHRLHIVLHADFAGGDGEIYRFLWDPEREVWWEWFDLPYAGAVLQLARLLWPEMIDQQRMPPVYLEDLGAP